jgi:adenylate cyclase
VKLTGDGMLVEFPSVVNAVACASEIQSAMVDRNADIPPERRIEFRVGINLGDVIVEDDDIYGDGVNVAARLEGISEPGGIAISGSVRDHIGNRLDLQFEDLGDKNLKNIAKPVRAYSVVLRHEAGRQRDGNAPHNKQPAMDKPSIAVLPFDNKRP